MYVISFFLAADASILIFNPSIYRKTLVYVNDSIGSAWSLLYGLLFSFCAIFILISILMSGLSIFYLLSAIPLACLALFFILMGTEAFKHLSNIWISLSNMQYRIAGIIFIALATIVCYVTTCVQ